MRKVKNLPLFFCKMYWTFILLKINFTLQNKSPIPKQNHFRLRLRGRNLTAVDVWNRALAGHSPHQSPLALRSSYALPLVRLTRIWPRALVRFERILRLRGVLTYLNYLFWAVVVGTGCFANLSCALGFSAWCVPLTCCIHYIIGWLICQFILCKIGWTFNLFNF